MFTRNDKKRFSGRRCLDNLVWRQGIRGKKLRHNALSLMIAMAMIVSTLTPVVVLMSDTIHGRADLICSHVHTEQCLAAPTTGHVCTEADGCTPVYPPEHTHSSDCYTLVGGHTHDNACYAEEDGEQIGEVLL